MTAFSPFVKKGYGRIYVAMASDVLKVTEVLKEVDLDEYEGYYPKGEDSLVTFFHGKVELIYTYKYEACMDAITLACWKEGIWVWCISQASKVFRAAQPNLASWCRAGMCDHKKFGNPCPEADL